jgi:hypothetical protein
VTARLAAVLSGALACAGCVCPGTASAQEPGTEVGGTVPSYLELGIDAPASLAAFPATPGLSLTSLAATITATDAPTSLSVADGDADAPPALGHLAAGGRVLRAPLQATVGSAAFVPFDGPLGVLLASWSDVIASRRTVIRLRQPVSAADLRAGPYAKTVLITASTQTP